MRETTQVVKHEVDGEEMSFQIRKLNAFDGAWLFKFATEKILPLYDNVGGLFADPKDGQTQEDVIKSRTDTITTMIPAALASITQEELTVFMRQCLSNVSALLDSGWRTVLVDDEFMVPEVEYDTMLALVLCYDVIAFNMQGFFGGGRLASVLKRLRS